MKILNMSMEDRLCYLTLLCLASSSEEKGLVKNCDEETVIKLANIPDDYFHDINPFEEAHGCLKRFSDKGMITNDNAGNVIIVNFKKRQEQNLTGYERIKRYREKQKNGSNKEDNNDNTENVIIDNARLDKNRIDKIINKYTEAKASASKKMQKYQESRHSTDDEPVVDLDSGEIVKKGKLNLSGTYKKLCEWAENQTGKKFTNYPKQFKALKEMRELGLTPDDVKKKWSEMQEGFWKDKDFDFMTVRSTIKML